MAREPDLPREPDDEEQPARPSGRGLYGRRTSLFSGKNEGIAKGFRPGEPLKRVTIDPEEARRLSRTFSKVMATPSPTRMASDVVALKKQVADLSAMLIGVRADTHAWLVAQSLGLDEDEAKLPRYMPMRVYLAKSSVKIEKQVAKSLQLLLEAFGFDVADALPVQRASFFQPFITRSKEVCSRKEVAERLKKVERALELQALGKAQADIDEKQASAAASLLQALADVPNAALQVGSVLLVKVTGADGREAVQVRTLTQRELMQLESNPHWLKSPADILELLALAAKPLPKRRFERGNGNVVPAWPKLDVADTVMPKAPLRPRTRPRALRAKSIEE